MTQARFDELEKKARNKQNVKRSKIIKEVNEETEQNVSTSLTVTK